jgi:hypothetical protein
MERGIFGDALLELLDGGKAGGEKSEVERAKRSMNDRRASGRLGLRRDGGGLGRWGSGLFLGCGVVLGRAAVVGNGEEEHDDQESSKRGYDFPIHFLCHFRRARCVSKIEPQDWSGLHMVPNPIRVGGPVLPTRMVPFRLLVVGT